MTTPSTEIAPDLVKKLRDTTNAGMMDCKKALVETKGDLAAAEIWLRKKGAATASKKADREAKEGVISSYIHAGEKVGVLIEVNCETDFVARTPSFKELVKDLSLQVAAASPRYLSRDQVCEKEIAAEKEVAAEQMKGKPENVIEKIVVGKLDKFYATHCLLEQAFIKDPNVVVRDMITAKIAELGENIVVRRFTRYQLGEGVTA